MSDISDAVKREIFQAQIPIALDLLSRNFNWAGSLSNFPIDVAAITSSASRLYADQFRDIRHHVSSFSGQGNIPLRHQAQCGFDTVEAWDFEHLEKRDIDDIRLEAYPATRGKDARNVKEDIYIIETREAIAECFR